MSGRLHLDGEGEMTQNTGGGGGDKMPPRQICLKSHNLEIKKAS